MNYTVLTGNQLLFKQDTTGRKPYSKAQQIWARNKKTLLLQKNTSTRWKHKCQAEGNPYGPSVPEWGHVPANVCFPLDLKLSQGTPASVCCPELMWAGGPGGRKQAPGALPSSPFLLDSGRTLLSLPRGDPRGVGHWLCFCKPHKGQVHPSLTKHSTNLERHSQREKWTGVYKIVITRQRFMLTRNKINEK